MQHVHVVCDVVYRLSSVVLYVCCIACCMYLLISSHLISSSSFYWAWHGIRQFNPHMDHERLRAMPALQGYEAGT